MNPLLTASLNAIEKQQKQSLLDDLNTALPLLQSAYDSAEQLGIRERDYELMCAIGDALNGCNEALEQLNDSEA